MAHNDMIMAICYSAAATNAIASAAAANRVSERESRKWAAITAISSASSRDGDKLLDLMERNRATNLQQITAEQAEAYLAEMNQGGAGGAGLHTFAG